MLMISISFKNLLRNRTRTFLSIIGIVIGVASIISLVSVVDGLFADVENVVGQVQGVRIVSSNGDPVFSRIDSSFESRLDSFPGVRVAVSQITGPAGEIDGRVTDFGTSRIIGIDFLKQQKARSNGLLGEITEGRLIRPGETGVAIIGKGIKDDFGKFLGSTIEVNDKKLKVIGVYSTDSSLFNSSIVTDISDARDVLDFPAGKVSGFILELVNPADVEKIADLINFQFKDDFVAFSSSSLTKQFSVVIDSFRLLVVAVAAISSIVAGVGIINTMLMSVIERFSEIGVLKSVGWTNSSIMKMILFESILIGFFGGITGIVVGFGASFAIHFFFGLNVLVLPLLVLEVFLYALLLGAVGGAYPAYVASKMDPVEALRFE